MNTLVPRLLLGLGAVLLLANCVAYDEPYYGGSYYGGTPYYSRPYYGGGYYGRPYYGGGYYGGGYYGAGHGYHDHDDHHNGHDDHDDHYKGGSGGSSGSSNRSPSGQLKNDQGNLLYRYGSSQKGAPQGNHPKDWYAERGYDLDKLKPSTKPAR